MANQFLWVIRLLLQPHKKDLTFLNIRQHNKCCLMSFIRCPFGWRAGSIGELTHVNGQRMRAERLMFRKVEWLDDRNDSHSSFFLNVSRETLHSDLGIIEKEFPL